MVSARSHSEKKKRSRTKRNRQTNKFAVPRKPNGKLRRARYFKVYRPERTAISMLENTRTLVYNRKSYRANRYLYYVVIPHLAKFLSHEPDRVRICHVESDLYTQMMFHHFKGGRYRRINRSQIWSRLIPSMEHGQNLLLLSQKEENS